MNLLLGYLEQLLWPQTNTEKDERPAAYAPKPGFVWNPLKRHRNIPCPCQSGLKAKQCCGQFEALPADLAEKVKAALRYEGHT